MSKILLDAVRGCILTGMKKSIFTFVAMAVLSLPCAFAHDADDASDSAWQAPCITGKTSAERWDTIAKNASGLIGLTKDQVEQRLGKGKYNDKHMSLMYSITDNAKSKGLYDSLNLSLDKDGKVYKFVVVTASKD